MSSVTAAPLHRREENTRERLDQERAWIEDAACRDLDPLEYVAWTRSRSSHRLVVHKGRSLVLWQCSKEQPTEVSRVWVGDFEASSQNGSSTALTVKDREILVGHSPVQIAPNLFVWLPFYVDLQRIPEQTGAQGKLTKFSLIARGPSNPHEKLVEGGYYLSNPSSFSSLFSRGAD